MGAGDSRGVMKRCRECKRRLKGTAGRAQWCDCGGEMITIRYGARRTVKRGR